MRPRTDMERRKAASNSPARRLLLPIALAAGALAHSSLSAAEIPKLDASVYDRAANFLGDNARAFMWNVSTTPHWRGDERFTYRQELGAGRARFVVVQSATGERGPAFDAAILAQGLTKALGAPIDPLMLPFSDFDEAGAQKITVQVKDRMWTCSTVKAACAGGARIPMDMQSSVSPDGKWVAYIADNNLWVRAIDGGAPFALTTDGGARNAYGVMIEAAIASLFADGQDHAFIDAKGRRDGLVGPIAVTWSPDSRRLFASKVDERGVREITTLQSAPQTGAARSISSRFRMAQPDDPVLPTAAPWVFDIKERTSRKVLIDPIQVSYLTPAEAHQAWWSKDGARLYLLVRSRYLKSMTLYDVDLATGAARKMLSEDSKTYIEASALGEAPMVYVLKNNDILWFSERDGWGRLYLYGPDGVLKRRLTDGPWTVRNVLCLDEARSLVYIAGNEREPGADPYLRKIYSVRLTDGQIKLLTPEDVDHDVASAQASGVDDRSSPGPDVLHGFSPSRKYFLEAQYRTEAPARTFLRAADGRMVSEVEHTDISRLTALGFTRPERFQAVAADGKTLVYGDILRPANFDPTKSYPVLDAIYPGPQRHMARPRFEPTIFDGMESQAYAELGFIVVLMDGRGTEGRSKTFHDISYGALSGAENIDDHVAAIKQLAKRYAYMDVDRVGIFGTSAGGYASAHAMLIRPDFFKAAVSDAGNHDQKGIIAYWGETYNGPQTSRNYADASNVLLADRLNGRLMISQGDLDTNVPPAVALQFVNALTKANKDFDLVIAPNIGHGVNVRRGYGLRRAWDFMVRNLMGAQPPQNYVMPPAL